MKNEVERNGEEGHCDRQAAASRRQGDAGAARWPCARPARGQHHGVLKAFNERTANQVGTIIPVEITIYEDRSFTFITKTPPAAVLIKQALGIEKGSPAPHSQKVGTISRAKIREIAALKLPDLNCYDLDAAERIIAGTARSMGVVITD